MASAEPSRADRPRRLLLDGHEVEWRLVRSAAARKLRIRVGPGGIQVVLPEGRDSDEAAAFLADNRAWVAEQLARMRRLLATRRDEPRGHGRIAFRGEDVAVRVVHPDGWRAPNRVVFDDGAIAVTCKLGGRTPVGDSLENWLRKRARERIELYVAQLARRTRRVPNRVYVMGQRTKWGNCSALGNLSFNWRLIMAPDHVLHYIVTHEMVHLAVPDHSRKFWLAVQSLCPEAERARQWLVVNGHRLQRVSLGGVDG